MSLIVQQLPEKQAQFEWLDINPWDFRPKHRSRRFQLRAFDDILMENALDRVRINVRTRASNTLFTLPFALWLSFP